MQTPLKAKPQTHTPVAEFIRETIKRDGPVTFRWFMEQALYHPEHGYYASGRAAIGRRGDYFTNVSVGPLFGRLLALQFGEMWETLGRPEPFTVVEQGAHDGKFAADVLRSVRSDAPELAEVLRYRIIEPFAPLRAKQEQTLVDVDSEVAWHTSLDNLEPFCGVHFSNELFDSLPVHLISRSEPKAAWTETYVANSADEFAFVSGAVSSNELANAIASLPLVPTPYETEINLAARELLQRIADKLLRGYLLAIDYGYSRGEYYSPHRTKGTSRTYAKHRVVSSPLDAPGEHDITAHVEWTSLAEVAIGRRLHLTGFVDQHHFVAGMLERYPAVVMGGDFKTRRELQTLMHPELLGRTYQLLVLSRGVLQDATLSGLKFARDPHSGLGSLLPAVPV